MFALLLSEKMNGFYQIIGTFPTLLFTIALVLCAVYWAGAVLGLVDLDVLDIDFGASDINADSPHKTPDVFAGLMMRSGLRGVPLTVSLSFVALFGWLICYYAVYLIPGALGPGILKYLLGFPILLGSAIVAIAITSVLVRPLKPLFDNATQEVLKHIIGQVAVVRTSRADNSFGEAALDDGGAGLILKIRTSGEEVFHQGDRVVILEELNNGNTYRVVSEKEFSGS